MFGVRILSREVQSVATTSLLPGVDQTEAREAREIGQSDIGRNRQEQNEPLDPPFARNVANAKVDRVGGRFEPHLAAGDFESSSRMGSKAGERARQFFTP